MHINTLEDTVIVLSDSEDDSIGYRKAQKMAKIIKRKWQEKKTYYIDDSDNSDESQPRRRAPRFREQPKENISCYYPIESTQKQNRKNNKNDREVVKKNDMSNESPN